MAFWTEFPVGLNRYIFHTGNPSFAIDMNFKIISTKTPLTKAGVV